MLNQLKPFADFAFPVCYALMSPKTTELYVKVFQKVQQLEPQFASTCAMADFEEASVAGFQHVYPDAGVAGCWFCYAQAIIKLSTSVWSGAALSGLAFSVAPYNYNTNYYEVAATGRTAHQR